MKRAFGMVALYALLFFIGKSSVSMFGSRVLGEAVSFGLSVLLPMAAYFIWRRYGKVGTGLSAGPSALSLVAVPLGAAAVLAVTTFFSYMFSQIGMSAQYAPRWGLLLCLLFDCLLPAVGEELLCRGLMLRCLEPYSVRGAVFVSALTFGLLHMQPVQMIYATVSGIILGYITLREGSLLPAVVIHFLNNATSVLRSFGYTDAVYIIFGILPLTAIAAVICAAKNRIPLRLEGTRCSGVTLLKNALLSPWIILLLTTVCITVMEI